MKEILKVSAKSDPKAVAVATASVVRQCGEVELQAIGAGAVNQAVKSVAIARSYLISSGIELMLKPSFLDVELSEGTRTMIRMLAVGVAE